MITHNIIEIPIVCFSFYTLDPQAQSPDPESLNPNNYFLDPPAAVPTSSTEGPAWEVKDTAKT